MNVLLAEANVPYEQLKEMDEINQFRADRRRLVVGANDVINPGRGTTQRDRSTGCRSWTSTARVQSSLSSAR